MDKDHHLYETSLDDPHPHEILSGWGDCVQIKHF